MSAQSVNIRHRDESFETSFSNHSVAQLLSSMQDFLRNMLGRYPTDRIQFKSLYAVGTEFSGEENRHAYADHTRRLDGPHRRQRRHRSPYGSRAGTPGYRHDPLDRPAGQVRR